MFPTFGTALIRVVVADPHPLFCDGVRTTFDGRLGYRLVGTAHTGDEALHLCRAARPDVVVLNIDLPNCSGLEALSRLRAELPEVSVIATGNEACSSQAALSLEAGACLFLPKMVPSAEILAGVQHASEGRPSPRPILGIPGDASNDGKAGWATPAERLARLTVRERQVLRQTAHGRSRREVAADLCIKQSTVRTHLRRIREKLGIHSVVELALFAKEQGLR